MKIQVCGDSGGKTKNGRPCLSMLSLSPSNGLCIHHDPERKQEVREMRSRGGKASVEARRRARAALPDGVPRAPRTLQDAVEWSSWAMHAVAVGEIDARTGHEIGYLVNAFKAAVEKRDLEREMEKLRAELKEARRRTVRIA